MSQPTSRNSTSLVPAHAADFHGASIIDTNGKEIPITEAMIQESLGHLIRAWESQQRNSKP